MLFALWNDQDPTQYSGERFDCFYLYNNVFSWFMALMSCQSSQVFSFLPTPRSSLPSPVPSNTKKEGNLISTITFTCPIKLPGTATWNVIEVFKRNIFKMKAAKPQIFAAQIFDINSFWFEEDGKGANFFQAPYVPLLHCSRARDHISATAVLQCLGLALIIFTFVIYYQCAIIFYSTVCTLLRRTIHVCEWSGPHTAFGWLLFQVTERFVCGLAQGLFQAVSFAANSTYQAQFACLFSLSGTAPWSRCTTPLLQLRQGPNPCHNFISDIITHYVWSVIQCCIFVIISGQRDEMISQCWRILFTTATH